jgi:glycosyltransferase involved in cell wall biosynthesis/2-polyprenyl-3-methyl-5-hydroxy-6-metoxy-1,4-benzoquinol methylase
MRVTVSVAGRFHAFHLVEQLQKRGHLQRFITSTLNEKRLPNRRLPDSLRNDAAFLKRVHQVPLPEYLGFVFRQLPVADSQSLSYFVKDNLYDRSALQYITNSDLFVGWASQSLFQMREAKARGARAIIERGSTHITEQYRLIDEERKRFGVAPVQRSRWDRLLEEKQLKEYHEADFIMTPSEFARQSFLARGFDPAKVLKVRYGVDLDLFSPLADKPISTIPTILFVGAIGFQKGIPYLLEAVRALRVNGKKFNLKLIGRFEKDFEAWIKSSPLRSEIDEHIAFVPNRELVQHFHQADIFVLPSVQEGLALVVAEAMASGLPVIATENTGASEFIESGKSGIIVPAGNADALSIAIVDLLDNPEKAKEIGKEAASKSNSFGWDTYGEAIEVTYANILHPSHVTHTSHKEGTEISTFYDEYWNRDQGWTPTHSFTDQQIALHFKKNEANVFQPNDSVLDVGCGDASNYQSWMVKQVRDLKAIDISAVGIAQANKMGLDAKVHDLSEKFPFESNSFDGAVCIEVLEHLYDPKFTVSEIFRVLKPGGLLVTSVPNNGYFRERLRAFTHAELSTSISDFSNEWKGAHIRFYNLRSFTRLFEVCGFQVESVRSNGDSSIFDGLDAFGGYMAQHASSFLRRRLPRALRLGFLENVMPSIFAPHLILWVRKPSGKDEG